MKGFINPTNLGRVTKMLEALDLIEKSALSNKASAEEVRELLEPLLERLFDPTRAAEPSAPTPEPAKEDQALAPIPAPGTWAIRNTIRQLCEEAPLDELTVALAIYLDRIWEVVHTQPKK